MGPVRIVLRALFIVSLAGAALADKVVLKDGREYDGVVLEETDTIVKIKTKKATLSLPKDQVASVQRDAGTSKQAEVEARLSTLDPASPAAYLETAKWLTGAQKDCLDLGTLNHVCQNAALLDPAQACEAQMILAKELDAAGKKEDGAMAWFRAAAADPKNADAAKKAEASRHALEVKALREINSLMEAIDSVVTGEYAKAIPRLFKVQGATFTEKAPKYLGMTIVQFAEYLQAKIKCAPCLGTGQIQCKKCNGKGFTTCGNCDGNGHRDIPSTVEKISFARLVCSACVGTGAILCDRCEAERDVTIVFDPKNNLTRKGDVKVHLVGGHEKENLSSKINIKTWQSADGFDVSNISPQPLTKFGKVKCPECGGIPFDPAAKPVDQVALASYRAAIEAVQSGKEPLPVVPADLKPYDPAVTGQGPRYHDGRWAH